MNTNKDVQKCIVATWFIYSCSHDFDKETSLEELFKHFTYYCDLKKIYGMSKKMFSILLKEYLHEEISTGSVKVQPASKVLYRGVYISTNIQQL